MQSYFDWPYAVVYLILIVLAFLYNKSHQRGVVTASIAVVFVFVGFRAPTVGADTFRYIQYLTGEISAAGLLITDDRDLELFFVLYRDIVSFLTNSRFLVMVLNTIIAFSPVFFLYKKYSFNPPLSFLIFFFLNCTNVYFIGLRQILGFSFILWALLYYIKRQDMLIGGQSDVSMAKRLKFKNLMVLLLGIAVGYLFHSSMIIYGAIILFWLFVPLKSRWVASALILGSFVIGIIQQQLDVMGLFGEIYMLGVADDYRLGGYLLHTDEAEITGTFSLFRYSLIGLVSVLFIEKEKLNHIFTKLFITGVVLFNLFLTVPMLARFNSILYMFGGVVFTWVYIKRRNKSITTYLAKFMSFFVVLYFCYAAFMYIGHWTPGSDDKFHPYYFIFQNYPNHE